MSETPPEPAAEPAAVPEPSSDEPTVKELAGKVDRIIDLLGQRGQQPAEDDPVSVKAEIRQALKQLRADERARAADHPEPVIKAEPVIEKPPREFRKVTQFMKWANEDDK